MKKYIGRTLKCTFAGAGLGLVAGMFFGIFIGLVAGLGDFMVAFAGGAQEDPNIGMIILAVTAIGAACGFLYGLFWVVRERLNNSAKRTNPAKEVRWDVTFSASEDNLPALIKLVTDSRLVSNGASVVNSAVQKGEWDSYTYTAVIICQDVVNSFLKRMNVVDIPGQGTRVVTRLSVTHGYASLLVQDCADMLAQLLPPGTPCAGDDIYLRSGALSTTIALHINTARAAQLKAELPSEFVTIA
jgi:hypothetical protein